MIKTLLTLILITTATPVVIISYAHEWSVGRDRKSVSSLITTGSSNTSSQTKTSTSTVTPTQTATETRTPTQSRTKTSTQT